jgi:RNA polymerase sigma-70 factor (ECF subfamily)
MDRGALARLVRRARSEWPALGEVTDAELEAFILARFRLEHLDDSVPAEDLLLACACARNVRAGHDALWELAEADVNQAYARIRPPITPNEARQLVFDRLLVPPEGGVARIGQYGGEGSLAGFVRSFATRTFLNVANGRKALETLEEAILRDRQGIEPELAALKKSHLTEFRVAITLTVASLTPRERELLRYAVAEDIGVKSLGRMYAVPRATAVEWLQAAREKLELRARQNLGERLRVSDRDLANAVTYVTRQLDLALARGLAE